MLTARKSHAKGHGERTRLRVRFDAPSRRTSAVAFSIRLIHPPQYPSHFHIFIRHPLPNADVSSQNHEPKQSYTNQNKSKQTFSPPGGGRGWGHLAAIRMVAAPRGASKRFKGFQRDSKRFKGFLRKHFFIL